MNRLGFRYERGGAHLARAMMLEELQLLLSFVDDPDSEEPFYFQAIEEKSCLGKRSGRTRRLTARHLRALYALGPDITLFRILRFFWNRDMDGQPLLALLCAYARDSILRSSAAFIQSYSMGETVSREALEEFIDNREPGRFSQATLKSTAQNINSTWTQSGHLQGRVKKIRSQPKATPGSVSYALLLGYLNGIRGESIFKTEYAGLLDCSFERSVELATEAAGKGWIIASDSLGWVYQFWQAKKKDAVNASEVKIGARELPAVTQLFTEPYMVAFLLDNSLGAWWAARRLSEADLKDAVSEEELRNKAAIPGVPLEYLRFVKVEAASSRLKQIGYLHKNAPVANLTGNLPHWRQEGVTYFVTFRTADSLPHEKLNQWQAEKKAWIAANPEPHDEKTKKEFYEKFPQRLQRWLDLGHGECLLKQEESKAIVENALRHFDGERYDLDEFVVMPNHIHVLVSPKNGYELSDILHAWKSFTANKINSFASKTGAFWQKESFDHVVRHTGQLEKIRKYIREHFAYGNKRQDAASTISGWMSPNLARLLKRLTGC